MKKRGKQLEIKAGFYLPLIFGFVFIFLFSDKAQVWGQGPLQCLPCGTDTDCDDRNVCTEDTCCNGVNCAPQGSCKYLVLDGQSCDDGNDCTQEDRCRGNECVGEPKGQCGAPAQPPCPVREFCNDNCLCEPTEKPPAPPEIPRPPICKYTLDLTGICRERQSQTATVPIDPQISIRGEGPDCRDLLTLSVEWHSTVGSCTVSEGMLGTQDISVIGTTQPQVPGEPKIFQEVAAQTLNGATSIGQPWCAGELTVRADGMTNTKPFVYVDSTPRTRSATFNIVQPANIKFRNPCLATCVVQPHCQTPDKEPDTVEVVRVDRRIIFAGDEVTITEPGKLEGCKGACPTGEEAISDGEVVEKDLHLGGISDKGESCDLAVKSTYDCPSDGIATRIPPWFTYKEISLPPQEEKATT